MTQNYMYFMELGTWKCKILTTPPIKKIILTTSYFRIPTNTAYVM